MDRRDDSDLIGVLRRKGLQVTYQRLAIYQALRASGNHPSAEVIYDIVRKRFPMISLGTVYKTLERFHDAGLIRKINPMTEVARYDAMTNPHHHLICLKCQSIEDLDDSSLGQSISIPETNGFQVIHQHVFIQGYCMHCK